MSSVLVSAIRDSCGYLQDSGWHQTARLMTLAASEIERLAERVRELEAGGAPAREQPSNDDARQPPAILSLRGARTAVTLRRPRP